ncbi:hypothetical protein Psch_02499 [Pelotomaculum schinkii]|uniref:DUF4387 domain-containing protein n=1 Tax=Pelotomaculum schinkii TaxID=78350 RepID=A0A4Y7R915_9FIRM|nr:DUF4387 domain-containing protein [Pelotomaculum schinkii]TEB05458.1 hypothetical protein Psch_02499 [Pelotomaculum schinkii]
MKKINITELASVVRSKNSGPYELTFDIIFKDRAAFEQARRSGVFTKELIAGLYNIDIDKVIGVVEFEAANAIKATIVRPVVSGALGETDVYGAQQNAPLLSIEVPVSSDFVKYLDS